MLLAGAQAEAPDQPILRITVNLVQVDASVTDNHGRQVTDLKADDFNVFQDGKRQKVTHCTYIRTVPESPPAARASAPAARGAARASTPAPRLGPLPRVALRRDEVRRSIAVVVDDLNMSFQSVHDIRPALHKFIDEQMQPGDLVAIMRTAGDIGALQEFTSDKRKLHAVADRLKWYWQSSTGLNSFSPTGDVRGDATVGDDEPAMRGGASAMYSDIETIRRLIVVANGLDEMPGRKSIVLFAEINLFNTDNPLANQMFERLADASGRAGAPIYAIDARGLPTLALRASDNPRVPQPADITAAATTDMNAVIVGAQQNRMGDFLAAQESMKYLAQLTGGLFFRDNNDLSVPLGKALDDQQGYYLLGYTPDPSTFDAKTGRRKFHKISVHAKRKGLTVRTQAGFLGEADKSVTPPRGSTDAVVDALVSPFGSPEIEVGMTALFFNDAARGSHITTLVNAKAGDLTFHDAADGRREIAGDIAVLVFADTGEIAEKTAVSFSGSLRPEEYDRAMKNGFLFTMNLPVKKPGAYDVRAAVRDKASGKIGTAGEFVVIPDLKPQHMALSGILLETPLPAGAPETDLRGGNALRVFHPGDALNYDYEVLNPKLEPASHKPQLEAGVKLYRDGKEFYVEQPAPVPVGPDVERQVAGGILKIGPKMPPGEYVLEAVVTDLLADKDNRTATQLIDFRIAQ
jgi:VWFA-related protein